MNGKELEKIYNHLSLTASIKVQIILLKNKVILRDDFELIKELRKVLNLSEYSKYLKECDELIIENGDKNENGSYSLRDKETYINKKKELDEKYESVIKEQLIRNFEFNNFMEEEIDKKIETYSLEDLPDDLSKYSEEEIETLIKFVKE